MKLIHHHHQQQQQQQRRKQEMQNEWLRTPMLQMFALPGCPQQASLHQSRSCVVYGSPLVSLQTVALVKLCVYNYVQTDKL